MTGNSYHRSFFLHIEEDSPLLNLHPVVKLALLLSLNLVSWILEAPLPLLILLVLILLMYKLFRIPIGRFWRFLPFVLIIAQAVTISYLLGSRIEGSVVYYVLPWGAYISDMTLLYAFTMILRFTSMLMASTMVLAVIRDTDIIYGLVTLRIPFIIAYMFNLALRFSSLFIEDFAKIRDAMVMRGARLDSRNPFTKARLYSMMGIPLMVLALRRMNELTYVLEFKGLGGVRGRSRTYLYDLKLSFGELILFIILIVIPVVILLLRLYTGIVSFPGWLPLWI